MKTISLKVITLILLVMVFTIPGITEQPPKYKMTTEIPESITTPDKVETSIGTMEFFDGIPTQDTVNNVYDYMDRARAVQVYIETLPIVSMQSLRTGGDAVGSKNANQFLIAQDMLDSKPLVLTANTSTLYTWSFLDLEKDGPTVIELPPGMLGALNDMYFRYIADLGIAGQDKGKGGKYLVLPPGYQGDVPDGYFIAKPRTNGVWVFMRGYVKDGIDAAVENVKKNLNAYPLSQSDNPPMAEFINVSDLAGYNTIPPNDYSFYEMLNDVVQTEPIEFIDPETRGLIASIGIVKGQDFNPDERMKKILIDAVAIGNTYARANTVFPRDPGNRIYGPDSEWIMAFADKNTTFIKDGALNNDARLWMHYNAIVVTPAMAVTKPGKGSDYGIAGLAEGQKALDGSKTYKLNLPANVPVKDFWAVTIYDTQSRSQLQTDQQFPTVGSQTDGLKQNADGSFDIYFSPNAPQGQEGNWLQTIPGKSWFIILRMYGPLEPWLNQTWRPGEIELVE
ncbi:MAG: DUF1254 domain-containing protein [Thermodesulfobacteriota bacterium]